MKLKIQIKSVAGSVLFEFEKENNTIKDTVVEAMKRKANLSSADLRSANLSSANLRYAANSELAIAMTRILPEGDLIGYKRCLYGVIVRLLIPKEAKRSSAFGRKCRAEFATVLEISTGTEAKSLHDNSFTYHVGDVVRPSTPFDENWVEECSTGIHFYITRLEAEQN